LTPSEGSKANSNAIASSSGGSAFVLSRVSDVNGEIAKISVHRTRVRPGESIIGTLDFREAVVLCTQYCASLIAIEQVPQDAKESPPHSSLPASISGRGKKSNNVFSK